MWFKFYVFSSDLNAKTRTVLYMSLNNNGKALDEVISFESQYHITSIPVHSL